MTDLITRLETAAEGSRELDAHIHARQLGGEFKHFTGGGALIVVNGLQHGVAESVLPHYTTSLDAALTLVPEGWAWMVQSIPYHWQAHTADLWIPSQYSKGLEVEKMRVDAATPALALCIAALRARG